jgi:hypothetical protein
MTRNNIVFTIASLVSLTIVGAQLSSCNPGGPGTDALQAQVQRLQQRLDSVYTPGLGEFMSGIQVHHEKLWFAGKADNWELADFELGEIKESLDDIRQYCSNRPEVASLPMIQAPLDSLAAAVKKQDPIAFKAGFLLLTTTCNNCHQATKHGYNVIQIPTTPPFSNQVFSTK